MNFVLWLAAGWEVPKKNSLFSIDCTIFLNCKTNDTKFIGTSTVIMIKHIIFSYIFVEELIQVKHLSWFLLFSANCTTGDIRWSPQMNCECMSKIMTLLPYSPRNPLRLSIKKIFYFFIVLLYPLCHRAIISIVSPGVFMYHVNLWLGCIYHLACLPFCHTKCLFCKVLLNFISNQLQTSHVISPPQAAKYISMSRFLKVLLYAHLVISLFQVHVCYLIQLLICYAPTDWT